MLFACNKTIIQKVLERVLRSAKIEPLSKHLQRGLEGWEVGLNFQKSHKTSKIIHISLFCLNFLVASLNMSK